MTLLQEKIEKIVACFIIMGLVALIMVIGFIDSKKAKDNQAKRNKHISYEDGLHAEQTALICKTIRKTHEKEWNKETAVATKPEWL